MIPRSGFLAFYPCFCVNIHLQYAGSFTFYSNTCAFRICATYSNNYCCRHPRCFIQLVLSGANNSSYFYDNSGVFSHYYSSYPWHPASRQNNDRENDAESTGGETSDLYAPKKIQRSRARPGDEYGWFLMHLAPCFIWFCSKCKWLKRSHIYSTVVYWKYGKESTALDSKSLS